MAAASIRFARFGQDNGDGTITVVLVDVEQQPELYAASSTAIGKGVILGVTPQDLELWKHHGTVPRAFMYTPRHMDTFDY